MEKFLGIQEETENLLINNGIFTAPVPIQKIVTEETDFSIAKTIFSDNTISGFIDFKERLILVNKLDSYVRQRFTIAHELGHWILHRDQIQNDSQRSIFYRKVSYLNEMDDLEKQANYFAANLLVPECIFKKFSYLTHSELADTFKVSKDVIELRRNNFTGA